MSAFGWKNQFAAPVVHGILTAGLPSRGMTVAVTDLPLT